MVIVLGGKQYPSCQLMEMNYNCQTFRHLVCILNWLDRHSSGTVSIFKWNILRLNWLSGILYIKFSNKSDFLPYVSVRLDTKHDVQPMSERQELSKLIPSNYITLTLLLKYCILTSKLQIKPWLKRHWIEQVNIRLTKLSVFIRPSPSVHQTHTLARSSPGSCQGRRTLRPRTGSWRSI